MQRWLAVLIVTLGMSSPLSAQWFSLQTPGIPRTPEGAPDLGAPAPTTAEGRPDMSGLWVPTDARGSLFDRDNIQPWALEVMAERESRYYANDPRFHCLPDGPASYPAGASVGGMRRIVQHPDHIAVLNPDMRYRQIFMDGRQLEEDPALDTWLGYSVGHWEGDTLVVESNGFNDKTWLTREGLPHTDQLRITESYHRPDFGHIRLVVTYEDPGTFTEPVQAEIDLEYRADTELLEIVCNESETAQRHYSSETNQAEEKSLEIPQETLERYTGTYEGIWLGNLITAEIRLEDGALYLTRTPPYSDTGGNHESATTRLTPRSETAFDSSFGLGWVFNLDEKGQVESVSEVHVSGEWPFRRVR